MSTRRGTSIIDLLVSLGILALLFGGIYLVYFSIVDGVANIESRAAGASILNQEVEIVRNLPYDKVGTVGGIPAGVIPTSQAVTVDGKDFTLAATIRNIDDNFDGTATGTPADAAPADYKLVAFEVSCALCQNFVPLKFTTTVAPKNLESASSTGSLFISVFNAAGVAVSGATVRVQNSSVSPAIDETDTTNADGVLQLVGVPTSSQSYSIQVSKSGYSSEQTYPQGGAGNPNPVKPHATVAAQTVTSLSFAIDRVSTLIVSVSGNTCSPYANMDFSMAGAKLIGASPDVLKLSTTSATGADGTKTFSGLEWDTYTLGLTEAGYDLAGTIPLSPLVLDPNTTATFRFVARAADPSALLVTVTDAATGAGIAGATVKVSRPGFSATATTSRADLAFTDLSGSDYASQSGDIDTESQPGSVILEANASGTYPTAGDEWLISNTIDLGGSNSTLYDFSFQGSTGGAGSDSLKFQLAANNDGSTWNFIGPDGSASTYYTAASTAPAAALNGKRYLRYQAFLSTDNGLATPELDSVSFTFSADCVPPYQALFSGLANDTYDVEVTAPGYTNGTSTITVSSSWQATEISL